jgi:hypothetical protein
LSKLKNKLLGSVTSAQCAVLLSVSSHTTATVSPTSSSVVSRRRTLSSNLHNNNNNKRINNIQLKQEDQIFSSDIETLSPSLLQGCRQVMLHNNHQDERQSGKVIDTRILSQAHHRRRDYGRHNVPKTT